MFSRSNISAVRYFYGKTSMYLTVIIPTFNGGGHLVDQLEALAHQEAPGPFEVIISDNGSSDDTLEIVRYYVGKVPGLRIVDSSERRGRSYARNMGAEAALAEALAFSDQDDVVGKMWVRAMGSALQKYDFVTGPIDGKKLNEAWQTEYKNYQMREPHIHQYPPYLAHVPANNLGIKRAVHRSIGGFDESLTFAWEDVDYAFRLQLAGTKLHFEPEALVYYRLRHDFGSIYRQARAYGKGNVAFYKKYEPMGNVREPWKARINAWMALLRPKTLLSLWKKSKRAWWLSRVGWQVGHIQGCITYCIIAPLFWL